MSAPSPGAIGSGESALTAQGHQLRAAPHHVATQVVHAASGSAAAEASHDVSAAGSLTIGTCGATMSTTSVVAGDSHKSLNSVTTSYNPDTATGYLDDVLNGEFEGAARPEGQNDDDDDDDDDTARGLNRVATCNELTSVKKSLSARIAEHRFFAAFFMILTFYALFVPDLDTIYGNKTSQTAFQIATTAVVFLFMVEIVLQSLGKAGYFLGAYFWLDLMALVSLFPETYLFQVVLSDQNLAAGRSTRLTRIIRVVSRSSKTARLNRLSRIVRVAALMPRIQRFFGKTIADDAADRLLEKKLFRIFQFLDEDLDGCVSRRMTMTCAAKLRSMQGPGAKSTWASKVAGGASGVASRVTDTAAFNQLSEKVSLVVRSASNNKTGSSRGQDAASPRVASPSPGSQPSSMEQTVENLNYAQFRQFLMCDESIAVGLRRACKKQLKASNNMQNITSRNSEYIGVKVALCVLLLLFVLTVVESVTYDNSAEWGLKSVDGIMQRQFNNVTTGMNISPVITKQVAIWSQQGYDWGNGRTLLYLDLNKYSFCNTFHGGEKACSATQSADWGPKRTSLEALDVQIRTAEARFKDLQLYRYPKFWDEEISAEELEERVTSIALLNKRALNENESTKSVWTTLIVTVIILTGITMLTKDLTFLSKNLLKPLVELADEMESITRMQLAGVSGSAEDSSLEHGTSEIRLIRRTFENMKKAIKSWGKYVPWPVVQLLLRKDAEAMIDVTEREVTIYFSDIASFTTIVENLPPESSLLLLSRYFHDMSKIIDEYGGIVLEFIGDAIMSVYGAPVKNPDHATAGVKAAVRMLAALKVMNVWFAEKNLPQVAIRCGVHTGTVLVGNMGFQQRMKYGVVGEESDIPGRLEELNKNYDTEMLISQATYSRIHLESFIIRPIDYINLFEVAGAKPELVYQVIDRTGKEGVAGGSSKRMAVAAHTAGMQSYRARDFEEAAKKFGQAEVLMHEATGEADMPSSMMLKRCRSYIDDPPPAAWEGMWDRPDKH